MILPRATPALVAVALSAATLLAQPQPQPRFSFDLRGAIVQPLSKLAGTDLKGGLGMGTTLAMRIQPHLRVYTGWDWMHFAPSSSFAGADKDFEETGYTLGLRFQHPLQGEDGGSLAYRVELGGTWKHIEIEDSAGNVVDDSGYSIGLECGAGVAWEHGKGWRATSMLRFRSLSPEFTIGSATTSGRLRYAAIEVGIARRF